jgi:hypothetical protein
MGFGFRIFLIDEADNLIRIAATRFDRLRDRDPKERLFQFKNSRIRYAMVILELENRKPISIARVDYGFLALDSEGRLDQEFFDAENMTAMSMLPSIPLPGESPNIIRARDKFAQKNSSVSPRSESATFNVHDCMYLPPLSSLLYLSNVHDFL